VAVTNGDSPEKVVKSIHQIGVEEFDHVLNNHADLWRHFEVSSHPTLVFVEPDGTFSSQVGGQSINRIQELVEGLIERSI
jgi:hypothetical protein